MKKRRITVGNPKRLISFSCAILVTSLAVFILIKVFFAQATVWDKLEETMGNAEYTPLPPAKISANPPSLSRLIPGDVINFYVTVNYSTPASPNSTQSRQYTDFPLKIKVSDGSAVEIKGNMLTVQELDKEEISLTVTVEGNGAGDPVEFTYILHPARNE